MTESPKPQDTTESLDTSSEAVTAVGQASVTPTGTSRGRFAVIAAASACIALVVLAGVLFAQLVGSLEDGTPAAAISADATPASGASPTPGEAASGTTVILPTPTAAPPLTFGLASPSEAGALSPAFPPITVGPPTAFPPTHSMFFALVCPTCESDGVVRARPGATVLGLDLVRRIPRGEPIAGASFGRRLFLLLDCRVQTCDGGVAERADLLQSDDEGETWRSAGSRAGAYTLVGVDAEGVPLVRAQDGSLYRWGSLTAVPPPPGASVIAQAGGWWSATTGEYFGLDGRRRFEVRSLDPRTPSRALLAVVPGPDGRLAVWWSAGEPANLYLSIVDRAGAIESTRAAHFRPIAWLDTGRLLGMVLWLGTGNGNQQNVFIPAIMDIQTGTVAAIPEPFTQPQFMGPGDLMLMFGAVPR